MSENRKKPGNGVDEARLTRERMAREMDRLGQQGEKIIGGGMFPDRGEPPGEEDAIEIWGRRIGRGLGLLFALYLVWHLLTTYILTSS